MSKPLDHARNSVAKYGGSVSDYLPIHELLDSSKANQATKKHRALTHNSWFISTILPKVFGSILINSEAKEISVVQIGEDHVSEDFGGKFIPSANDWLAEMQNAVWMENGADLPPSMKNAYTKLAPPIYFDSAKDLEGFHKVKVGPDFFGNIAEFLTPHSD